MAELKPVPSGYDSAALSSMLGYLANARKSHDNNPFMRTILDQQARDNKAEYLADADLTVRAQQKNNADVYNLDVAKLIQEAKDNRLSRAVTANTTSGGGLITDELAQDFGVSPQGDATQDNVRASLAQAAALKGRGAQSDIRNKDLDSLLKGSNIIENATNQGDLDGGDISNPPLMVTPNNAQRPDLARSAAQGQNAAVVTTTKEDRGKYMQDYASRSNPNAPDGIERIPILRKDIEKYRKEGWETSVAERSEGSTSGTRRKGDVPSTPEKQNVARPINDLTRAQQMLAESGGMIDGQKVEGLRFNDGTKHTEALIKGEWVSVGEID